MSSVIDYNRYFDLSSLNASHKTITRRGYILEKDKLTKKEMLKIRSNLTVKPNGLDDGDTDSFEIYYEDEKYICVPRFYGVSNFGKPKVHKDFVGKKIDIKFNGEPRPKQKEILDSAMDYLNKNSGGILKLYCGFGKTVLALILACLLGYKTLILVHKTGLQNQWIERIKTFTNASIGIIRQNKVDVKDKDIVVGMVQSISMKDYEMNIFDDFGVVIFDECHRFGSKVHSRCFFKINAPYMIGLSATPIRKDGLTKILYWYIGDIMYKLERKGDKRVICKLFEVLFDDKKFTEKKRWRKGVGMSANTPIMINNLVEIKKRNKLITKIIWDIINNQSQRKILILSDRISHLEYMNKKINKKINKLIKNEKLEKGEITSDLYIGKMKKAQLEKAQEADIIFASYTMASEGLDIPELNCLILSTPKSDIVQCVGRILRKQLSNGDTNPLIIDISDNLSVFKNQTKKRMSHYKSKHYTIEKYYALNGKIVSKMNYAENTYNEIELELYKDFLELGPDEEEYEPNLTNVLECKQICV